MDQVTGTGQGGENWQQVDTLRGESASTSWRCSFCGSDLDPQVVVECDDCLYVYCREHEDGELHLCAEMCAECGPEAFGD